jgi:hypothetical protein
VSLSLKYINAIVLVYQYWVNERFQAGIEFRECVSGKTGYSTSCGFKASDIQESNSVIVRGASQSAADISQFEMVATGI